MSNLSSPLSSLVDARRNLVAEVFAIGDCAVSGKPPTAQVAYQQGLIRFAYVRLYLPSYYYLHIPTLSILSILPILSIPVGSTMLHSTFILHDFSNFYWFCTVLLRSCFPFLAVSSALLVVKPLKRAHRWRQVFGANVPPRKGVSDLRSPSCALQILRGAQTLRSLEPLLDSGQPEEITRRI
jgi:hypothetical protein